MNDIVKYSACVKMQHNQTNELMKTLPRVFERELRADVAREVKATPTIVSFHGGASREAQKRHRWVTTWNLLTPITRGAVKFEATHPQICVSFWLGFPRVIFYVVMPIIIGMAVFLTAIFLIYGEPLTEVLPAVLFLATVAFIWLGILPLGISIVRFHWFVRMYIRKAEREIEKATLQL